jgi:hypothetical protein
MFAASHAARKATIRESLIYGAEKPERGKGAVLDVGATRWVALVAGSPH